jgi:hypothetical protein
LPRISVGIYEQLQKGIKMDARIIELAIEALQRRRSGVEAEIEMIEGELRGRTAKPAAPVAGKRRPKTAAQRKAQAERMRAYWAARKGRATNTRTARKTAPAKPKMGPQSAAARKAQSERMKAYWAKRKAEAAKVQTAKKPKSANARPGQKNAAAGKKAAESKSKKTPF